MGWQEEQLQRAKAFQQKLEEDETRKAAPVAERAPESSPSIKDRRGTEGTFSTSTEAAPAVKDDAYDMFGRKITSTPGTARDTARKAAASSKRADDNRPLDPAPSSASGSAEIDPKREEARRQMDGWEKPSSGTWLEGYVASDVHRLETYEVRSGLRRWFYSLWNWVPFPTSRSGFRFLLRSDDINRWERNVLVYGDIYGGSIHRGSNLRLRGRLDARTGDIIARDIRNQDAVSGGRMIVGGVLRPWAVALLSLLALALMLFIIAAIVALVFNIPVILDWMLRAFEEYGVTLILIIMILVYCVSLYRRSSPGSGRRRRW